MNKAGLKLNRTRSDREEFWIIPKTIQIYNIQNIHCNNTQQKLLRIMLNKHATTTTVTSKYDVANYFHGINAMIRSDNQKAFDTYKFYCISWKSRRQQWAQLPKCSIIKSVQLLLYTYLIIDRKCLSLILLDNRRIFYNAIGFYVQLRR